MQYTAIQYEISNKTGLIRLNRPERMNAVNEEMYREIGHVLSEAAKDNTIRSLILTGSKRVKDGVEKEAFCAGADLKKHSTGERSHGEKREYIKLAHRVTQSLYEFPKPVIAAINGPARGAGAEMAFNCDFIFMASGATIAFPEIGLGTFVGGGVTAHLPKIVGLMKAKELVFTGTVIDAEMAVNLGIALKSVPVGQILEKAQKFAALLAEKAPVSMELAKKRMQQSGSLDMETVLQLETDAILSCMDTEDWHEGIKAFMEKRAPEYKGR